MDILNKIKELFSSTQRDAQKQITDLYNTYKKECINYICKNDIDRMTAEEIYNDSFMAMYKNLKEKKLTEFTSGPGPYLKIICRNKAYKYLGKQERFPETVFPDDFPEIPDTDEQKEQKRKDEIALALVSEMGHPCKEILDLYYLQRKKMREIAEAINFKNEDSVESKKYKCMKTLLEMLREKLKKEGLI